MTYAERLLSDRKDLALWVTISGIDRVFKERSALDCSTILGGGTRPESACLMDVSEGDERLDLEALAVVGGSLSFKLRQPWGQTFLSSIYRPRTRRLTWLTAPASKTDTGLTLKSTAGLSANQLIYIGGETIKIGTVASGTSLTGCTRGMHGSRAQAHQVKTDTLLPCAGVYTEPPTWMGRRVQLRGSFVDAAGASTAALTSLLGTYLIDDNPRWIDDRTLEVSCGSLLDEYMSAAIYRGFKEVDGGRVSTDVSDPSLVEIECTDAKQMTVPASGFPTHILAKREGLSTLCRLFTVDTVSTPNDLLVWPEDLLTPPGVEGGTVLVNPDTGRQRYANVDKVSQVAVVQGATTQWLRWILDSRIGDADNGSYDVLPGRIRTKYDDDDRRMGAGIHKDDTAGAGNLSGRWMVFPLMELGKARDAIFEACIACDAFAYVDASGILTLKRLSDSRDASVITLDTGYCRESDRPRVWVDEGGIYPTIVWRLNYNPITGAFDVEHVSHDAELAARFPHIESAREIESKALGVDVSAITGQRQTLARAFPMSTLELDWMARSLQSRGGRGRLMCERTFSIAASTARIGDNVTIAFDATDLAGGSLSGRQARVVGRRPNHKAGICTLTLEVSEAVYRWAPSSVIVAQSTISIAGDTYELDTAAPSGSSPQSDYHVGQTLRIWDVSAGTSTTRTVAGLLSSPPRIRFTAGAPAPEGGRDFLTWDTLGTSSGTSDNGDDEGDWVYFVPDNEVMAEGPTRRFV